MLIENPEALNSWLINYLEPKCEADPQALAKYIMALIKKDKPINDLKLICLEQLDVFLTKETKPFVEILFDVLSNKSYLPKNDKVHSEQNIQGDNKKIKIRSRSRSPKSFEKDFDRRNQLVNDNFTRGVNSSLVQQSNSRSPLKQRSRSPRKSPSFRRNKRSRSRSMSKELKKNKSSRSKSPINKTELKENNLNLKRRRCRDYDEKGFCMRGDFCMYDHGRDPVILDTINASSVLGLSANNVNNTNNALLPTPNNFSNNQTTNITEPYNPEAPAMDAQVKRNVPMNPNFSLRLPQQYWPTVNDNRKSNNVNTANMNNNQFGSRQRELVGVQRFNNEKNSNNLKIKTENSNEQNKFRNNNNQFNGNLNNNQNGLKRDISRIERNRSNSNYRGNKKSGSQTFNNDRLDKTTLEVRKIPISLNTISHLNQHFSKFGTIKNLQVGFDSDSEAALIQYFKHSEALAAYRSTEAVLNNRFIKVFWHNNNNGNLNNDTIFLSSNDSNLNNSNTQTNANLDSMNKDEKMEINQINEKKGSIKDRLSKLEVDEKVAFLNNNVVNNLLNSGLISNTPNQLASLVVPSTKTPVYNPALFKKQYASIKTSSNNTATSPITTPTLSINNTNSINSKNVSINKEKLIKKLKLQKKRQNILSTSMNEQKILIEKLEKAKTEKDKGEIKSTLDILIKQIKELEQDILKEALSIKEESKVSVS